MGNWNGDNSVNTQTLPSSHSQMHLLSGGKQTLGRGEDKCMCIHWLLKDNFSKTQIPPVYETTAFWRSRHQKVSKAHVQNSLHTFWWWPGSKQCRSSLRSNHPQFTHQTLLDTHLQSDDQHVAERKQMKDDVITICISAHSAVYLHTDDVQGRNLEVRDERWWFTPGCAYPLLCLPPING